MGIYLWGTGCGASEAIEKGLNPSVIEAFVDSNPCSSTFMGKPVISPSRLRELDPELIVVTSRMADEIALSCRNLGIPESRLLFIKDAGILCSRNKNCEAAERLLGKELLDALLPEQHIVTAPSSLRNPQLRSGNDYVRTSALELICRRISGLPGAAAELGVYKGSFAACINKLLPERKLYLFDSFSGFSSQEAELEKNQKRCGTAFIEAHKNTAVELVLGKMEYPENVIIKKGFFPDSLDGLEEHFALVSLDADFRDSTLEGLRYFWPRLNPGGYLMLHDWGSPELRGVSEALSIYEREIGRVLPGVPLPDLGNSLIMQKF